MKFADNPRPVYVGRPVSEAPNLDLASYTPNGNTALLDAVGVAIDEAGSRFRAMTEAERPGKVLFVIVTDGEENSSKVRKKDKVASMIKIQQDVYKWEFVFMGASIDAFAEAGGIGIGAANTLQASASPRATSSAYSGLSYNTTRYRSTGESMAWTEEQRKEQEER